MVDGAAVVSCVTPIVVLEGRSIRTVEGLGTIDDPGPVQRAFIEEQAAQCGYCIPGMMMQRAGAAGAHAVAVGRRDQAALKPNLCRCGTHMRIMQRGPAGGGVHADRRCRAAAATSGEDRR